MNEDESDLIAVGRDAETGRKIYVSKARLQIQFIVFVVVVLGVVLGLLAYFLF
jgi:hypothetical protein